MRRISYTIDKEGTIVYFEFNKTPSKRGTKFNIPTPKGGRYEKKYVFTEDTLPNFSKLEHKRLTKKKEEDPFKEDAIFFEPHKKDDERYVIGQKPRKNPNIPKRRTGRKKNSNR